MLRTLFFPIALLLTIACSAQGNDSLMSKHARKAQAALDNNKAYRALKICDKGLGRKPPAQDCYALRAEALNRTGDPREAIVNARMGMRYVPTAATAELQLGIGYHAIGMRDSAEIAYRNILESNVGTEARYRLALVERETGRIPEALNDLKTVTTADPNNAKYMRDRGVTFALLGDSAGARADFDRTVEMEPGNPVNWNTRGFHRYAAFGDHQRAIKDYNAAIKLDKNHGYAFNNRGWSKYKLGNTESGLRDIRLAGRKNPSNAMVDRNLGVIANEQGNLQLACTLWRTALDKDFTSRFGTEVEDLVKQHCGQTTTPAPKDIQDLNAPKQPPAPKRGNAP
ncbi:MAG: tetratricopeptide repeat protein [Flavobacteriales bacterium]|nr:tetratricopeptide repeat protein [Flavobacteriales bacterium]